MDLEEVRNLRREWIEEYNYRRPHESMNNLATNEWKVYWKLPNLTKSILSVKWGAYNGTYSDLTKAFLTQK